MHVVTVDGGPDENPRYRKVIDVAIRNFLKYKLDALFLATNAPRRSAFNRVERRMAPLSRELAGLVLPHDHYGSHLNDKLQTADVELEKKNFRYAGKTLAEVWNDLMFDGFPVVCEYVDPAVSEISTDSIPCWDSKWFASHVRSSQYFLQIVKCANRKCCSKPRSSYFYVMPEQFFSAPIRIEQTDDGLKAVNPNLFDSGSYVSLFLRNSISIAKILPKSLLSFREQPYNLYCPSVQKISKHHVAQSIVAIIFFNMPKSVSRFRVSSHTRTHTARGK